MSNSLAARTLGAPGSRRRRISTVVGIPFLSLALVAAAWAVFFGRAEISGGGESGSFAVAWKPGTEAIGGMGSEFNSVTADKPTISPAGVLSLPDGLVFWPGDRYRFGGAIALPADASEAGHVSGLSMTGLPSGYTATIVGAACGASIAPGSSVTVLVDLKAAEDLPADGTSWTLTDAAVQVTPGPAPADLSCPIVAPGAAG